MIRSANILGLALGDRTIDCVELSGAQGRRALARAATFTLPEGATFDRLDGVAPAFAEFLKANNFSAGDAIVGAPAKWLIAAEREVPASSREQALSVLRMQAERMAMSEHGNLVCDISGRVGASEASRVLIVGMLRQRLESVMLFLEQAGLKVDAFTSSSLVLSACGAGGAEQPMLLMGRSGAEIVWQREGSPRMLRHLSVSPVNGHTGLAMGMVASELKRTIAMIPMGGSGDKREMRLWNGVGLSEGQIGELAERAGLSLSEEDQSKLLGVDTSRADFIGDAAEGGVARFAPAVALAVAAAQRHGVPVDFTASRLAPPKKSRFSRNKVLAVLAGVALVGGMAWLYIDNASRQSHLKAINDERATLKKPVEAAQKKIADLKFGTDYFETRPPIENMLLALTKAWRQDDRIFATSIGFAENGSIKLVGRATTAQAVSDLKAALAKDKSFKNVLELSSSKEVKRDQTFTLTFEYVPAK